MNDSEKASTKLATHCTSPAQLSLSLFLVHSRFQKSINWKYQKQRIILSTHHAHHLFIRGGGGCFIHDDGGSMCLSPGSTMSLVVYVWLVLLLNKTWRRFVNDSHGQHHSSSWFYYRWFRPQPHRCRTHCWWWWWWCCCFFSHSLTLQSYSIDGDAIHRCICLDNVFSLLLNTQQFQ